MERLRKHTTIYYSTHILDDVQRVSDTVVISNRGEPVAQGSIQKYASWLYDVLPLSNERSKET